MLQVQGAIYMVCRFAFSYDFLAGFALYMCLVGAIAGPISKILNKELKF